MATANYNEVTNSAEPSDVASRDPMFHWDTHFPERMSKLHLAPEHASPVRRARKSRARNTARFKTQPITFDEIKEVDEEPTEDSKLGIMTQFAAFSRSMDGLVPNRLKPEPAAAVAVAPGKPDDSAKCSDTKSADKVVESPTTAPTTPSTSSTTTPVATYTVVDSDTAMMNAFRRRRRTRQQRSIEEEETLES